jgi:SP family sugar:H+ symporter-like MFS transporter
VKTTNKINLPIKINLQKYIAIIYNIRIAAIASLGGFLFGFDIAAVNGAIVAVQNKFGVEISGMWLSVSPTLIGAAAGAFAGGLLAERFGQKLCMIFAAALFFASGFATGNHFAMHDFVFWRVICGLAIGMANVVIPRYIAETAPSNFRGRLGSFQQLAIVLGILAGMLINLFLVKISGGAQNILWFGFETWRWMFWMECIPAIFYGIFALNLPESPRFLVAKERNDDAKKVLEKLLDKSKIDEKINDIRKTIASGTSINIINLYSKTSRGKTRLYPAVIAGLLIAILQQFSGINVIFYYGNALWQSVGIKENHSLLIGIIISAVNVLTTIVAIFLIDKKGRKPLLLIGSAGIFVAWITMALIFGSAQTDVNTNPVLHGVPAILAIISTIICVIFFSISWGPVVWVMLGEMFNNKIRGAALSLAGLLQWLANLTLCTTYPALVKAFGFGGVYGIYAFFALFGFFFVLGKVQETVGKELEEM